MVSVKDKSWSSGGFTLLEILVAFAFVAIIALSFVQVLRTSISGLRAAGDEALAAQVTLVPDLAERHTGAKTRYLRKREIGTSVFKFVIQPIEITFDDPNTRIVKNLYR